jgi:thioredoxin reductase (NADPH)
MPEKSPKSKVQNPKSEVRSAEAQIFDAIIIGGGAAGLSAALWCDELGLKTLLLEAESEPGGQLLRVYNPIKNHLGAETENGRQLSDKFVRQIKKRNFALRLESRVSFVDLKSKTVSLDGGDRFSAKSLIIATGVRRRKLNVAGESEFQNRGIIESGKRDQRFVAGKNVLIVGGGDAALENASILSETAERVFLVHRRENFRARREFVEKALSNPKIKVLTETIIEEIIGAETVEAVKLKNPATGDSFTLPIEAVLVRIGVEPNSELFRGKLKLDKNGYIEVSATGETSSENVFAIGDIANPLAPTVSSAVGTGATAAKVIFDKLYGEM